MRDSMIREQGAVAEDDYAVDSSSSSSSSGERQAFLVEATVLFPYDDVENNNCHPFQTSPGEPHASADGKSLSFLRNVIESIQNRIGARHRHHQEETSREYTTDAPSTMGDESSSFGASTATTTTTTTYEDATVLQSIIDRVVKFLKFAYSMALIVFSVYVVMLAIFQSQTKISNATQPVFAFVVLWSLIFWLGMMEGGQGCLVGLQPVRKDLYAETHAIAYQCTMLAHKGDNMNRFIVGRQFLVTMVVFVINLCGSTALGATSSLYSLVDFFLASGLASILITVIIGQLTAQVNATKCMLDFINTSFMLFTTWASLIIEMSGLLHSVYLVKYLFSVYTGKPVASEEPPRSTVANIFFWLRVLVSSFLLGMSFAVTLSALFRGQTTMYKGFPPILSALIFFALMCFVGLMEGMQIALFAVVNMPDEELKQHPVALANCQLTFRGSNFQAFLIGRQICATLCTFMIARITTISINEETEQKVFNVSNHVQDFLNTGLPGALIATIVGSLAWRITASCFPLAFMSNPLIYFTIRLCLFLEGSGVCSAAWVLAAIHKRLVGFQLDEVYIGPTDNNSDNDDSDTEADATYPYPESPLPERCSSSRSLDGFEESSSSALVDHTPGSPSLANYGATTSL